MPAIQEIARTLKSLATPGMKSKELAAAVRREHPDATGKDVSRAAFFAVIRAAEGDPDRGKDLQDVALASRAAGDGDGDGDGKPGKRAKKSK